MQLWGRILFRSHRQCSPLPCRSQVLVTCRPIKFELHIIIEKELVLRHFAINGGKLSLIASYAIIIIIIIIIVIIIIVIIIIIIIYVITIIILFPVN